MLEQWNYYILVHVRRVFIHSFIMMLKNYIATTTATVLELLYCMLVSNLP